MRTLTPLLLLLLAACPGDKEDTTESDTGEDTGTETDTDTDETQTWEPRFDALAEAVDQEREELGAPGVAVAFFEGTDVTFAAGFGSRHPLEDDPVRSTTLFRIGSVTKVLTATGLLQQVEAGSIGLQDPVTDTIPEFVFAADPAWGPNIRVEHTLVHAGGFYDYIVLDEGGDELLRSWMLDYYLANLFLMAPPGRMWNYANPNYSTAGLLLEDVSGQPYASYMEDEVFAPLGMTRTLFSGQDVLLDGDYASGDTVNWQTGVGAAVATPDAYDSGSSRPAGFAWSSVHDLATFGQFLMYGNDAVLADTYVEEMQARQIRASPRC